jgi:glutamyl-Q tRNA(Asp) synthetase
MASLVTRFAPSPTGLLHLGHAHSALVGFIAAREAADGRFLVRIENIDTTRCRPELETAIYDDLAWLGIAWETPVRRQSEHFADYRAALDKLTDRGLIYPCFCTRQQIQDEIARSAGAPHPPTPALGTEGPIYPGTCRNLPHAEAERRIAAGVSYALRLDMDQTWRAVGAPGSLTWLDEIRGTIVATPEQFGDVVLARKETPTSYHLAVTVDDALQGVTLVTRGEDLFAATHVHRLLQALLDLPVPRYRHHGLVTDASGRRLAKRDRAATIHGLREQGFAAAEVRAMAGFAELDL